MSTFSCVTPFQLWEQKRTKHREGIVPFRECFSSRTREKMTKSMLQKKHYSQQKHAHYTRWGKRKRPYVWAILGFKMRYLSKFLKYFDFYKSFCLQMWVEFSISGCTKLKIRWILSETNTNLYRRIALTFRNVYSLERTTRLSVSCTGKVTIVAQIMVLCKLGRNLINIEDIERLNEITKIRSNPKLVAKPLPMNKQLVRSSK